MLSFLSSFGKKNQADRRRFKGVRLHCVLELKVWAKKRAEGSGGQPSSMRFHGSINMTCLFSSLRVRQLSPRYRGPLHHKQSTSFERFLHRCWVGKPHSLRVGRQHPKAVWRGAWRRRRRSETYNGRRVDRVVRLNCMLGTKRQLQSKNWRAFCSVVSLL